MECALQNILRALHAQKILNNPNTKGALSYSSPHPPAICLATLRHSLDVMILSRGGMQAGEGGAEPDPYCLSSAYLEQDPTQYRAYFHVLLHVSEAFRTYPEVVAHCRALHTHCIGTALAAIECAARPEMNPSALRTADCVRRALRRGWVWVQVLREASGLGWVPPNILSEVLADRLLHSLQPCQSPEATHHLLGLCDLIEPADAPRVVEGMVGYIGDMSQPQRSDVLLHVGEALTEICARCRVESPLRDPMGCLSKMMMLA